MKNTAQHTKDAVGAKFNKNVAEAKQTLKSGDHPELDAKKEAAKSQEKASMAAAKGHASDVSIASIFKSAFADSMKFTVKLS